MLEEAREYRRWKWFYDRLHLLKLLEFSCWACTQDAVPKTDEEKEAFDYQFLEEAKRHDVGWKSVSLNEYSEMEWKRIRRWVAEQGEDFAYLSAQTRISEVWALIGSAKTNCSCATVHPDRYESLWALLRSLPKRPCLAVFEGCKEVPKEVRTILRGKNVFTVKGRYGVAVSFEIISEPDYERIVEIAQQVSVREEAPPLWSAVSTSSTSTASTGAVAVVWTSYVTSA